MYCNNLNYSNFKTVMGHLNCICCQIWTIGFLETNGMFMKRHFKLICIILCWKGDMGFKRQKCHWFGTVPYTESGTPMLNWDSRYLCHFSTEMAEIWSPGTTSSCKSGSDFRLGIPLCQGWLYGPNMTRNWGRPNHKCTSPWDRGPSDPRVVPWDQNIWLLKFFSYHPQMMFILC